MSFTEKVKPEDNLCVTQLLRISVLKIYLRNFFSPTSKEYE
jgi:hypothetical protein